MGNQWKFLFEEGADFSEIRRRHRMEKRAGVFMRPSDIGGHTEIASALEGLLNGQPGGSTFKDHPGEQKTAGAADVAIGAAIGGGAGYLAANRINPVPPPQDTKGVSNKLQKLKHDNATFASEHPRVSRAVAATAGAVAGGYALKDANIVERLRDFKRGKR